MQIIRLFLHLVIILTGIFNGCSSVQDFIKTSVHKPQVQFAGVKLTGLSFQAVDLLFDLTISNPNSVGIKMAGFDYDFLINNRTFVQGNQEKGLKIQAKGENTVQIPISLRFADVYQSLKSYAAQDSTKYQIKCGFAFDLPILGTQRIPVSKTGSIPLLKFPELSVESLQIKSLNLLGADLQLNVKIANPNAIAFIIKAMNYQLEINNNQWLTGESDNNTQIPAKDKSHLTFPISLNFLQLGQSVKQLLNNEQAVDYKFTGNLDLASSIPLLKQVTIPFDQSGRIRAIK